MKKLERPLKKIQAHDIYIECANAFTSKISIKENAIKYEKEVAILAQMYEEKGPQNIMGLTLPSLTDEECDDIIKLYDQKFSKLGEDTRKYYDAILANGGKICPICGVGKRRTLDHFLPKSKYPLLCVTPLNLVPTCRDCNMEKGAKSSTDYYEMPFNPYFDDNSLAWLTCRIDFGINGECIPQFYNGLDKTQDPGWLKKCEVHISNSKLDETFQNAAVDEIENVQEHYWELYKECGEDEVKKQLRSYQKSCERIDINSWRAALYSALSLQYHEFCEWLKKTCKR